MCCQGVGRDLHPPSAIPIPNDIAGALIPPREPIPKAKQPPAAANNASQHIRSTPQFPADPFIRQQVEVGAKAAPIVGSGAFTTRERHQTPPPPRGAPSPTPLYRNANRGEGGQRHIRMALRAGGLGDRPLTHREDR